MKETILVFPNTILLSTFILTHQVSSIVTNSSYCTIQGRLSEQLIDIAIRQYDARMKDSGQNILAYDEEGY